VLDNEVVSHLRADVEARDLYLSAVVARVLGVPWPEAGPMAGHVDQLAVEVLNPNDCGACWCSIVLLAAARLDARCGWKPPGRTYARSAAFSPVLTPSTCEESQSMFVVTVDRDQEIIATVAEAVAKRGVRNGAIVSLSSETFRVASCR
jgi:hypothetical protein